MTHISHLDSLRRADTHHSRNPLRSGRTTSDWAVQPSSQNVAFATPSGNLLLFLRLLDFVSSTLQDDGKAVDDFLGILADLISKGREVRLIHAKEPGPNFREDFDRYPILFTGLERALCPRVHFKMIILDSKMAYIGSANLTGAGIGMKGTTTRNFEAGILTDDPVLVEAAMNQFDSVWAGFKCRDCRRKQYCGDPILK